MPSRPLAKPREGVTSGQIGVKDPFQLIRHLARSQSDPRKAVAELVQNALDEQASHVVMERWREAGEALISIRDDGKGVLPEMPRPDALRYIAKNIGHSRKRQLSFDERMRQAMLGQYGIGILGFWALGHEFRMISRVAGSEVWVLTLWEDSPKFEIETTTGDLTRGDTWTEVQVRRLHPAAMGPTSGLRLSSYLSVELRGQLLRHAARLTLVDRLARGTANRRFVIRPSELQGEKLEGIGSVAVPGYSHPIELELFYAGDADPHSSEVKLACAGAVVVDRLGEHPDFARPPWNDPRLAGLVDFPHLEIPPGSRRGFVPNEAASALARALASIEPLILEKLKEKETARAAQLTSDLHRQLARIFSKATSLVPHLEWFPVSRRAGKLAEGTAGEPLSTPDLSEEDEPAPEPELFAPGPLAEARILPQRFELAVGEERVMRARAFDAERRRIVDNVSFRWSSEGPVELSATEGDAVRARGSSAGEAAVRLEAASGEKRAVASAHVSVISEARPRASDAGIPQPQEINEPLQSWRSRTVEDGWQINVGHPDYKALADEPRRRLRYLANLLAKEIISRNFPRPEVGTILEEMVGLLTALERSGAWS